MSGPSPDERLAAGVARLRPADAGEVLTLQLAAWVREGRDNGTFDIPPLTEDVDDVRAQLADPATVAWGLRERGRLLAIGRYRLVAADAALIGRLGVVPDLRGHGLGSAMLRHVEASLPAPVRRIELVTGLHSVANHAFYARHGYAVTERRPDDGIVLLAKGRQGPTPAV